MAAEMAVGITAQGTVLTEDRQEKEGHSAREDRSEKVLRAEASEATVREDRSESIQKEEASEVSVREDHLARIQKEGALGASVREDLSVRIQREEASEANVREDRSEKIPSIQEGRSARTLKGRASGAESQQPEEEADSTERRKASIRRTSTISAMRTKAESTR